jgi:hypothetical protein
MKDLAKDHLLILKLLSWINPDWTGIVRQIDRFPHVHGAGPATFESQ